MLILGEPPPTPADIHFRLFGIPVRVHPFFWLMALILGLGGNPRPELVLLWVLVVFVSIIVHEMGHALTQRYFGGHPWITLYGFGGLASCNDCDRSPRAQLLILFAGPVAGFLFAGVVVLVLTALGRLVGFELDWIPVRWELFGSFLDYAVAYLLLVNILWGLLNLLPVYPLDGGQIAREIFTLGSPRRGIILSLRLSVATAAAVAALAVVYGEIYMGVMFGLLSFGSWQTLERYRNQSRW
jgi:stage IV sporulation protein FB